MSLPLRLFCFLALSCLGLSAEIINYKVYPFDNKVDIVFHFDAPFAKEITKSRKNGISVITIDERAKFTLDTLAVNHPLLDKMSLDYSQDQTNVLIDENNITLNISQADNGFSVRFRITSREKLPLLRESIASNLPLKESSVGYTQYAISFILVLAILGVYWFIKRKVLKIDPKNSQLQTNILYQRSIDVKTKIVLMQVNDRQYLVLLGAGHSLLLDTFYENTTVSNEKDFEKILHNMKDKKA